MQENSKKSIHRLQEYTTTKGITLNKLAIELGLSNSYFSKMVRNSGSIGSDIIEKIIRLHPDLSAEWLLTGNGDMLKTVPNVNDVIDNTKCPQNLSVTCHGQEEKPNKYVNKKDCNELNINNLKTVTKHTHLPDEEDFAFFQQEYRIYEHLKKANKVADIYDTVSDCIGDLDMILKYCNHYYWGNLYDYIDAYINNQITREQLLAKFKVHSKVVQDLEKCLKPYMSIFRDLYYELDEFDNDRDRLYDYRDIEIDINDFNNTKENL